MRVYAYMHEVDARRPPRGWGNDVDDDDDGDRGEGRPACRKGRSGARGSVNRRACTLSKQLRHVAKLTINII